MSNKKRVIVITGATRGLGRALVRPFIELGHTVVGCGRSKSDIADLQKAHPGEQDFSVVDVAVAAEVEAWRQRILAKLGPPDLLLNNAAIINENAPLWEVPAAEFDRVIDVNIKGVVNVIRAFVPAMVQKRKGVIVNFSSGWGRSTSPEVAPYCATKWAIEGLTQALSQELPQGMCAVPLNPGIIDTDMLRKCFGGAASSYPDANEWSKRAVGVLLKLGPGENGHSLSVG